MATARISSKTFLNKLYRLFENKPKIFKLKKLRRARGYCHGKEEKIELDYREELLSTLIHEALHFMYPDWEEDDILAHEIYLINEITPRQAINILKRFSKTL